MEHTPPGCRERGRILGRAGSGLVRFEGELTSGTLLRRYKRFLADVRLTDGSEVVAHCANPGSMKTCCEPGSRVWLSHSKDPRRKLSHTLELIQSGSELVFIHPLRANRVVEEALRERRVDALREYAEVQAEVPIPFESQAPGERVRSRVDFRLVSPGRADCWVEVKSCTLSMGDGRVAFPDAVSRRGTRHLRELSRLARAGDRAAILFCVSRSGARSFAPACHIDPEYAEALREAAASGVEVLAFGCDVSAQAVTLQRALPVHL